MGPGSQAPPVYTCCFAGVRAEEYDYFYEMIAHEEAGRIGTPGFGDALGAGMVIGMPPVVIMGPQAMKDKVVLPILRGEKRIALAISEPFAGRCGAQSNALCCAQTGHTPNVDV